MSEGVASSGGHGSQHFKRHHVQSSPYLELEHPFTIWYASRKILLGPLVQVLAGAAARQTDAGTVGEWALSAGGLARSSADARARDCSWLSL